MLPNPVSNRGPLTYESGALPIALRSPATKNNCPTGSLISLSALTRSAHNRKKRNLTHKAPITTAADDIHK